MHFNKLVDSIKSPDGTYYMGDPWRLGEKGLTILVPIRCRKSPKREYILSTEDKDKIKITDTGDINELKVDNNSGSPVFIRGGTVFKGKSGQDRAVVQGTVVQPVANPEKAEPITVRCVHAHRSITRGGGFEILNDLAPQEVYQELRYGNQHSVWSAVASYSSKSASRLMASPSSMHLSSRVASDPDLAMTLDVNSKARTDFSSKIMDALSKVPDYEDQVGVAIVTVDGVLGLELFDSPESWKALGKEVVKSFSEIFHQDESISDLFTLNMDAVRSKVSAFLNDLNSTTFRDGDGTFTAEAGHITCEYTNLNGNCIHAIISKKDSRPARKATIPPPDIGIPFAPDLSPDDESVIGAPSDWLTHTRHTPYISPPRRYDLWHDPEPRVKSVWRSDSYIGDTSPPVGSKAGKPKVGDAMIFGRLKESSYGFNDLQSKTGVPSATLARRLKEFADEGLVTRDENDAHGKWKLTAKGMVEAEEKRGVGCDGRDNYTYH